MSVTRINPALDFGGAHLHAQCRHLATVVTVTGRIGSDNVDALADRVTPYVLAEKPFILDLSGLVSCSRHVDALLQSVAIACDAADVEWSMVAGDAVTAALYGSRDSESVPVAHSVREALAYFAEEASARRRLLPILIRTA